MGQLPEDEEVPTPVGRTDVATLHSYNLAHLMMHGHPLSRALGRPSPVNRDRALLTIPFLQAVMVSLFDRQAGKDLDATVEIRLRKGPRFWVRLQKGECQIEPFSPGRVDCHISADVTAFYLVGAGVVDQWGPIAAGKMMAWGRKPWLAFRLKSLFPNP